MILTYVDPNMIVQLLTFNLTSQVLIVLVQHLYAIPPPAGPKFTSMHE